MFRFTGIVCLFACVLQTRSQAHSDHHHPASAQVAVLHSQPLLSQALRLKEALSYLGSPMAPEDEKALDALRDHAPGAAVSEQIQKILDPYCLFSVDINPEGRVKVDRGAAMARMIQGGWTSFLVKVKNEAGVTAEMQLESPNTLSPVHQASWSHVVEPEHVISAGQVANRFLEAQLYTRRPLHPHLTGFVLEYAVVQFYSKESGPREAEIGFNVGLGSQDIGFRNSVHVLFDIRPSVKVKFAVQDDDGKPVMGSFIITDSVERVPGRLSGIYPLPSRRVPAFDEYPDFFFQRQIYRRDNEHVLLPPGRYYVTYTRGPEYVVQYKTITIPEGVDSITIPFRLKRWINMAALGWHSGDHHVHASGCAHYDSPAEGVPPDAMWRQVQGEDLNVSALLTWGPSWYHQKQYFSGRKDNPLSDKRNIIRYDVEVSGFPSSHSGHIVLLNLKEDDYPGAKTVEEWPSWTGPVLQWAKSQGAVTGYAHSGWGLEPSTPLAGTYDIPNYVLPKMNGIGANEYVVTVTQGLVDIYSLGNTPAIWELNMWYHTLNSGFRVRASGETDFPCITDMRVGLARSYFKSPNKTISYDSYIDALKKGRSYVSVGHSHIMDFSANGLEVGTKDSELRLSGPRQVAFTADIAAYLEPVSPDEPKEARFKDQSFWSVEWSRIGETRTARAELIINGVPVDTVVIQADGSIQPVTFNYKVERSCWAAIRIWGSAHTNPIFITVNNQPIKEKRSAEWCLNALEQCWKKKEPNIRPAELEAAAKTYDAARKIYQELIKRAED